MIEVILVDEKDNQVGVEEKLAAHQKGKLHRAFSVFLFNSKGELLLQQRAKEKYHSGGIWSNTCCSHPKLGKNLMIEEVKERTKEEMGIKEREIKDLKEVFSLIYKVNLGDLTEYEFDHVFIGKFDGAPKPNPKEVEDWKWIKPEELKKDIKENPQKYAEWFRIILNKLLKVKKNN